MKKIKIAVCFDENTNADFNKIKQILNQQKLIVRLFYAIRLIAGKL